MASLKYRGYLLSQKRNMLLLETFFPSFLLFLGNKDDNYLTSQGNRCSYQALGDAHGCPLKNIFNRTRSLTGSTQKILAGGGNWDPVYLGWTPQRMGYRALASALAQSTASNIWFGGVPEVYASNLCLCQYLINMHILEGNFHPTCKMTYDPKKVNHH